MKPSITRLFKAVLTALLLAGCYEEGMDFSKADHPQLSPTEGRSSSKFLAADFQENRFFFFFSNSLTGRYHDGYGPDGISWVGQQAFTPVAANYLNAVFHNGMLYSMYHDATLNKYRTQVSSDGINWSTPVTISLPVNYTTTSVLNAPELFVADNNIYAYQFKKTLDIYYLQSFLVQPSPALQTEIQVASGARNTVGVPQVAKLGSYFYVFFIEDNGSSKHLHVRRSIDARNWEVISTLGERLVSNLDIVGDISAATHQGNIFITYKNSANAVKYIKYDGLTPSIWNLLSHTTSGTNVAVASDGLKIIVSFRSNSTSSNNFAYSYNGSNWYSASGIGTSRSTVRQVVYAGN